MANAILGRVHRYGTRSFAVTLDAELRRQMGLVERDVIAFRVIAVRGKWVLVGEKVPLHALANMVGVPPEIASR